MPKYQKEIKTDHKKSYFKCLPEIIFRNGCSNLYFFFGNGMDKRDSPRMQADTSVGIGSGSTVFEIAFDRASNLGQLNPDLMVSPGLQIYFQ